MSSTAPRASQFSPSVSTETMTELVSRANIGNTSKFSDENQNGIVDGGDTLHFSDDAGADQVITFAYNVEYTPEVITATLNTWQEKFGWLNKLHYFPRGILFREPSRGYFVSTDPENHIDAIFDDQPSGLYGAAQSCVSLNDNGSWFPSKTDSSKNSPFNLEKLSDIPESIRTDIWNLGTTVHDQYKISSQSARAISAMIMTDQVNAESLDILFRDCLDRNQTQTEFYSNLRAIRYPETIKPEPVVIPERRKSKKK